MSIFEYKALTSTGQKESGRLDVGGRAEAIEHCERQGWTLLRLQEISDRAGPGLLRLPLRLGRRGRVSFARLEDFTRSLANLLTAGVPLSRALSILHKETADPVAAAHWEEIHDRVIDGVSLSEAMARSPDVFPDVYVAMVESGETGGFLDVVLAQIADFLSRDRDLRSRITAALVYPCVVLVVAIAVLAFLLVFFIPRFEVLFEGFNATLPVLTRGIVAVSTFLQSYGIFLVGGLVLAAVWLRMQFRREAFRRRIEGMLLNLPLVGPLVAQFAVSRFCRMLGTLLGSGVPMLQALDVARRSLGYQTLTDLMGHAAERVQEGETLSGSLRECRDLFPGSTVEMISVAEESARLDEELVRLSDDMENRLDRRLKVAVALVEPVMLFIIAVFVGTIFLGMVIPIFTIQDYIQ